MPKNTTGGSAHKKKKNKDPSSKPAAKKAEDLVKSSDPEAHEYYACVEKPLGGRRFAVQCQTALDSQTLDNLVVKLAGSCRMRITAGTFVLVQRFPFNLSQGGIVQVFSDDDVATLKFAKLWDFPVKLIKKNMFSAEDSAPSFRLEDMSDDDEDDPFQNTKATTPNPRMGGKSAARTVDEDADCI